MCRGLYTLRGGRAGALTKRIAAERVVIISRPLPGLGELDSLRRGSRGGRLERLEATQPCSRCAHVSGGGCQSSGLLGELLVRSRASGKRIEVSGRLGSGPKRQGPRMGLLLLRLTGQRHAERICLWGLLRLPTKRVHHRCLLLRLPEEGCTRRNPCAQRLPDRWYGRRESLHRHRGRAGCTSRSTDLIHRGRVEAQTLDARVLKHHTAVQI